MTTTIRLDADEHAWLRDFARQHGVSVSGLFRTSLRLALGVPVKEEANARQFTDLSKQLTGVARNLNQMTRAANAGKLHWDAGTARRIAALTTEVRGVERAFWAFRRIASQRNFIEALEETALLDAANGWIEVSDAGVGDDS